MATSLFTLVPNTVATHDLSSELILDTIIICLFVVCDVHMSGTSHTMRVFISFLSMIAIFNSGVETISVRGEIFKAIKSDSSGDMVCSLEDPNEILNVRSKPECILLCHRDPSCLDVNWKEPDECEMYFSNPETFGTLTSCTYFSPRRGKHSNLDILFMLYVIRFNLALIFTLNSSKIEC